MEVIFGMQINVKLVLSFLMKVVRHVQNTQKRKLLIFLQYVEVVYVAIGNPVFCLALYLTGIHNWQVTACW